MSYNYHKELQSGTEEFLVEWVNKYVIWVLPGSETLGKEIAASNYILKLNHVVTLI